MSKYVACPAGDCRGACGAELAGELLAQGGDLGAEPNSRTYSYFGCLLRALFRLRSGRRLSSPWRAGHSQRGQRPHETVPSQSSWNAWLFDGSAATVPGAGTAPRARPR